MNLSDFVRRYLEVARAPEGEEGGGGAVAVAVTGAEDTGGDAGAGGQKAAEAGDTSAGGADQSSGTAKSEGNADEGKAGGKSGEGTEAPAEDSETYEDFTVPEGVEIDEQLLGTMAPVMKANGLNQEQAQAMVDAYAQVAQAQAEANVTAINQLFEGWVETAKQDKEVGGANWDKSVAAANAAVRQFGTPEFIADVLQGQGLGNHPEMIRFLSRVASKVSDDSAPTGEQTDVTSARAPEAAWYGETTPNAKKG